MLPTPFKDSKGPKRCILMNGGPMTDENEFKFASKYAVIIYLINFFHWLAVQPLSSVCQLNNKGNILHPSKLSFFQNSPWTLCVIYKRMFKCIITNDTDEVGRGSSSSWIFNLQIFFFFGFRSSCVKHVSTI